MIRDRIKEDLKKAMLEEVKLNKGEETSINRDEIDAIKAVCRAIISMYPEIGVKPNKATDDDTIRLLKKYIGNEKHRQLYIDKHLGPADVRAISPEGLDKLVAQKFEELGDSLTSPKIQIAKGYLPKEASEEEIVAWAKENVDFSQLKNKMQAMGPIMNNFKGMDGNKVKKILLDNF